MSTEAKREGNKRHQLKLDRIVIQPKKGLESGRLRRSPEKAFKVTSCRLSVTGWNDTKRNKATPVRCGPGYLITS